MLQIQGSFIGYYAQYVTQVNDRWKFSVAVTR